jgi:tungstate transport system ATP-binding protein
MSLFVARDLKKSYNGRIVLDLPTLTIEDEGMVALLGPNGAGKTTLLHILAFLLPPSTGRLWFDGRPVPFHSGHLFRLRRKVVLVEQHPILFSTTVSRNVAFGLKMRGLSRPEIDRRVDASLEMVGMHAFAAVNGRHLSGGETQRVAIARAIACRPDVILMDEPTSNVDVENRMVIESIMRDVRDARQSAIIFCTHDLTQAARLTHTRLHLAAGRLNGADYENAYSARVHHDANGTHCCIGDRFTVWLPSTPDAKNRVTLDPRKIEIATPAETRRRPGWTAGRIIQLIDEGEGVRVMVDVGVPLTVILTFDAYRALDPRIGETVDVLCPPEALSFL